MDMDVMEQEQKEEVKALRQEKHALQQKLQEAEVKRNHFIAAWASITGITLVANWITNHVITFK